MSEIQLELFLAEERWWYCTRVGASTASVQVTVAGFVALSGRGNKVSTQSERICIGWW